MRESFLRLLRRPGELFGIIVLLALAGLTWLVLRGPGKPARALIAEQPLVRIESGAPEDREAVGTFRLINRSRKPVTIGEIVPSCSCVDLKPATGVVIAPGGSHELAFEVGVPEAGVRTARINVYHDAGPDFVELRLMVAGRRALPIQKAIRNSSPSFYGLSSPAESVEVVVETREEIGSEPWLAGLQCELAEVEINQASLGEQRNDEMGLVERVYTYRVGWAELPEAPSFEGTLWLHSSRPGEEPTNIGRVAGTLANRRLFSPTTVLLAPGRRAREVVLFAPGTGHWELNDPAQVPSWLVTRWEVEGDERKLVLELGDAPEPGGSVVLHLASDRSLSGQIEVVSQ